MGYRLTPRTTDIEDDTLMKIVIADPLPASAADLLRDEGWEVDAETGRPLHALHAALADADALIVRSATHVDADLIAKAPGLKVIARAGTGVDNVDLEAASAGGILVVNAPGANSISVAEHTFALLLASVRSIAEADGHMKAGRWEKKRLTGSELRGKTLGYKGCCWLRVMVHDDMRQITRTVTVIEWLREVISRRL